MNRHLITQQLVCVSFSERKMDSTFFVPSFDTTVCLLPEESGLILPIPYMGLLGVPLLMKG